MEYAEELFEMFMGQVKQEGNLSDEQYKMVHGLFKEALLPPGEDKEPYNEERMEKLIEETIDSRAQDADEEQREIVRRALRGLYIEGKAPYEVFEVPVEDREKLFQEGRTLFQAGRFDEALEVFEGLNTLDPESAAVIFSIAACHHAKKEYAKAAGVYYVAGKLDPESPFPDFYLSDCLMNLELYSFALESIKRCMEITANDPALSQLHHKAKLMAKQLEEEMVLPEEEGVSS